MLIKRKWLPISWLSELRPTWTKSGPIVGIKQIWSPYSAIYQQSPPGVPWYVSNNVGNILQSYSTFYKNILQSYSTFYKNILQSYSTFYKNILQSYSTFYNRKLQSNSTFYKNILQSYSTFCEIVLQSMQHCTKIPA